jgi:hypothetical protein
LLALLLIIPGCTPKTEGALAPPPPSPVLSRLFIGYGVVNASYTTVSADPGAETGSLGYLRRGSIVQIQERRYLRAGNGSVSWVLVQGAYSGWVREELLMIYDQEAQAKTASEAMER